MSKLKDITGERFGKWVVLEQAEPTPRWRNTLWRCQCDCGTVSTVSPVKLRNETSTSCGCVRNEQTGKRLWKGYGNLSAVHWRTIVRCATSRNLELSITIEQCWNLFLTQQEKCALTGLPIEMYVRTSKTKRQGSASLDRIDSTKGYTVDNVQWVHKHINKMKMEFSRDYFIAMCDLVVKHNQIG